MTTTAVQRAFFAALLLLVTVAFLWLIRGFLQPVFWAVALGIIVYPLHSRLEQRLAPRRSLAAGLSMLIVVMVVILPLAGLITAVTAEAAALVQRLNQEGIQLDRVYEEVTSRLPTALIERLQIDTETIETRLAETAVTAGRVVASRALSIGQDTLRIAIFFFLMLYLLFFFLRDGPKLLDGLVRALPLGDERERHLLERFADVSRATIKGTLVVGIVQGTIGGIAFWILGINGAVLWGVVMALLSILPAVGPALVWLPAAIFLLVTGRIIAGLVLIAIGVLVIGLVDNLLRPVLVGRDTRMPDYLILLSTLGGLTAFGLAGIVIGPIIAAFFLSCWEMAPAEFEGQPHEPLIDDGDDDEEDHDDTARIAQLSSPPFEHDDEEMVSDTFFGPTEKGV